MILLINGKARSGKDTVADYIKQTIDAEKLWFAKPLKDFSMRYFKLTHDECYDHKTEVSRRVLQGIGQMFRDEVGKNFWVGQVIKNIVDLHKDGKRHFIISDCRYRNEIMEFFRVFDTNGLVRVAEKRSREWIKCYEDEYGNNLWGEEKPIRIPCYSLRVVRDNCPGIEYGADHPSENDLNDFPMDIEIKNDKTLEDLYSKVDLLLSDIGVRK